MATSLYDLSVTNYLQTLGGMEGFLGRELAHFQENKIDPDEIVETREALEQLAPADVDALEGKDVVFQIRDTRIPFTAEGFIQSFSLPNFYFHATTAYDILRSKGVPLGKRDFLGRMRLKT